MKKLLIFMFVLSLALIFTACGESAPEISNDGTTTPIDNVTTPPTKTPEMTTTPQETTTIPTETDAITTTPPEITTSPSTTTTTTSATTTLPATTTTPAATTTPPPAQILKAGEVVPFGGYDWRVLEIRDGKALLLSDRVLERGAYNDSLGDLTWADCSLRKYLNNEFFNSFSAEDRARITETTLSNNDNAWYETAGGSVTTDKIFLLSIEEVVKYFGDSGQLANQPTDNGWPVWQIDDRYNNARVAVENIRGASDWWLRSPGIQTDYAAFVDKNGYIDFMGHGIVVGNIGVRPALWVEV